MSPEIELRACTAEDWPAFDAASREAFSSEPSEEHREQLARVIEPTRLLVAVENGTFVGTAGAYAFQVTIPGGTLPTAGVTLVGVRPGHRRRGILGRLMRRQLADLRERGEPLAILYATEGAIYGRFGYGVGAWRMAIDVDRARARFIGAPEPVGQARVIGVDEALRLLPEVYERFRVGVPGSLRRSIDWWERRRLADPKWLRRGGGPMLRAVVEIDGRAEGYALYRLNRTWDAVHGLSNGTLDVVEAVGTTPVATREVWRFLLGVDLPTRVRSNALDPEHPLPWLLEDPRQLRQTLYDSIWVRVVDVAAALAARTYIMDGALTFELADPVCPWNEGVWRLDAGPDGAAVTRATAEPELRLAATDLGSLYLGGTAARTLLRAGRVEEVRPGAAARLDALLRTARAPWCGDGF